MSVAFQKIISPSSATFPGRRGSNQAFSLPPSRSLCSPLMPPNQPGGDIIILEPGVTVGRTPGAGSLVCKCVYMYVCCCACVCVAARVPLATSSLCESATACSNMHPELPAPMHFLRLSYTVMHTLTLTGSRYPVEKERTPELTYLSEYCL